MLEAQFQRYRELPDEDEIRIAEGRLRVAKLNFDAAESRITDADIADETGRLVNTQILQQVGAAVLSQANQ